MVHSLGPGGIELRSEPFSVTQSSRSLAIRSHNRQGVFIKL
jgi:hypothetical protein